MRNQAMIIVKWANESGVYPVNTLETETRTFKKTRKGNQRRELLDGSVIYVQNNRRMLALVN